MEHLPGEVILKICSYLDILDRVQFSIVSSYFNELVTESWQDYAVSVGWKKLDENDTWLETCKVYLNYRNKWFLGNYSQHKISFESRNPGKGREILSSIELNRNQVIGIETDQCISCYDLFQNERISNDTIVKTLYKNIETASNSLCLSSSIISAIDNLTSELVLINLKSHQENRYQLRFDCEYDICHITDEYIILLTDNGDIYLHTIGQPVIQCIHQECSKTEVSHSFVFDDWHLVVSFWSGKLISYNLKKPSEPIISLNLEHVFYTMKMSNSCLYYGSCEGIVGRVTLSKESPSDHIISSFGKVHSGSVYCIAINKKILVSGGADSRVIFWTLNGTVLYIDHMSHVGIVRHIFLNEWIMFTAGDAHVIIVWDPISLTLKHMFHHNPLKVQFMAANGTELVYGSPDSNYVILLSV